MAPTPQLKWAIIQGNFDISKDIVSFHGKAIPIKNAKGEEERIGLDIEIAMSNAQFSGGDINAEIEFGKIGSDNSCEIIFYYDAATGVQLNAGIGSYGAFCIRQWDGDKWVNHAAGGSRESLRHNRRYSVKVNVRGSRVTLYIDEVEVLAVVLPFSIPSSQVGLFCLDDAEVKVRNLQVAAERGEVFVVMQFTKEFTDIHEEVIKSVCNEFELDARLASDTYGPGMIISDIVQSITDSEFVIAEITSNNANVFYELGYAHGINKPVILLANRATVKLPFDVSPFRVLMYDNSIAGRRDFEEGLRKHISAVLNKDLVNKNRRS